MSGGGAEEAAGLTELLHSGSEVSSALGFCFIFKLTEQISIVVRYEEPARVESYCAAAHEASGAAVRTFSVNRLAMCFIKGSTKTSTHDKLLEPNVLFQRCYLSCATPLKHLQIILITEKIIFVENVV